MKKSTVVSTYSGFVGHPGGVVDLAEGEEYAADHPLVLARPDLFAGVPAVPGPVRAVETVGAIEEVDPADVQQGGPLSTVTAAPIVRRGRKPKNV